MEEFTLQVRLSPSDSEFKKLIGIEIFDRIKKQTFTNDKNTCRGCGYRPLDDTRVNSALSLHVIEIADKPEESPCITLCRACHSTQHIDIAIEKEWVNLVNSVFSQRRLIEMGRVNAIHNSIKEDDTRYLQGDPKEILERNKYHLGLKNCKLKVIFTNKFEWGDL